jgi:hypothetical protein
MGSDMVDEASQEPARDPQELERLLVARQRTGNLEGMMVLYEPDAVVDCGGGKLLAGKEAIRAYFAEGERPQICDRRAAPGRDQRRPRAHLDAPARRHHHLRGRATPG